MVCLRSILVVSAKRLFTLRMISTAPTSHSTSQSGSSGSATINGVRLHYEVRGTGTHPLVCIPGALGTISSDFSPQLDYFGRDGSGFKIVVFDPRGYGRSRPAERFKGNSANFWLTDAKDAHALMQHLSFPDFSVLGWSDGGISGLILSSMHPKSVRKLVVWGANAYVTEDDAKLFKQIEDVRQWNPKMREPLEEIYGDSLQELWSQWLDTVVGFYRETGGNICIDGLSKISCPTLVVHGAKDPMCPSFHADFLRDHVTGSRLEVFQDGKHNLHLRYHQKFNKMVENFLQS